MSIAETLPVRRCLAKLGKWARRVAENPNVPARTRTEASAWADACRSALATKRCELCGELTDTPCNWSTPVRCQAIGEGWRDARTQALPIEEPAVLMKAFRHAWEGDKQAAAAYVELAAQKLEASGSEVSARAIRRTLEVLQGKREPVFIRAANVDGFENGR